jgi:stage IV sporulation protein FB
MGWEDRRYEPRDGGTGFRAVLRRIFWDGESPMDWAVPLYTAWRIRVRIHLMFVFIILFELIQSLSRSQVGFYHMAIGMGSLFGLVLLHEYGHCIACRWVGGTADKILMWPLGGLAYCSPPHRWKADLITTAGGPLVNLILFPVFALALVAMGQGRDALIFSPLDPVQGLRAVDGFNNAVYWINVTLWCLYTSNAALFLFNMCLPMYPMDMGRIVMALIWWRKGHRTAMLVSTTVGMFFAMIVMAAGMVWRDMNLMLIGLFCGFVCFRERRAMSAISEDPALAGYDFERGYKGMPDDEDNARAEKARRKQIKKEQDDQAELDRILAKIAKTGMGSLSKAETKWLARATERRRGGA